MPTLTPAEVAADLKLDDVETVMRHLRAGTIPGFKVGRYWRVDVDAYTAWRAGAAKADDPYRIEPRSTRGEANLRRRTT